MVVITENTVKIIRMPEVQTKRMVTLPHSESTTDLKNQEPRLPWQYIAVGFKKYNNESRNYGFLLKYMLQAVKVDPMFKYNVMFQILPIILHHKNGMYYIILRIRVRKEGGDFVNSTIKWFNTIHTESYQMEHVTDPNSTEYLYKLYMTEYIHTGRNPQHPPPLSPRFREEPAALPQALPVVSPVP